MTEGAFVLLWLRAFALTVAVELAVAVPGLGRSASASKRAAIVALAQLATHPVLWFVIPALHLPRPAFLAVGELWAVVIEATAYSVAFASCTARRAVVVSLAANAASVLAGLAVGALG